MAQRFYANPQTARTEPNGAVSFAPGGPFDCIGPWAKVQNCPVDGTDIRLTCYATGYADTFFSVPACTRYRGHYVTGFFTTREDGPVFVPHNRHMRVLGLGREHAIGARSALFLRHADYMGCTTPDALRTLYGVDYVRAQLQELDPRECMIYLHAKDPAAWPSPAAWPESHYPYAEKLAILADACAKMRKGTAQ